MAISYQEIAEIQAMTNERLEVEYAFLGSHGQGLNEDGMDRQSVIEDEMERRGLPHP